MNKVFVQIALIVLALACMLLLVMLRLQTTELAPLQVALGRLASISMAGVFAYFAYSEFKQSQCSNNIGAVRLVSAVRVPMYVFAGAFMLYLSYTGVSMP